MIPRTNLAFVVITVTTLAACSTPSRSSSCGLGVEGASCTATKDCECGLHCFEGACVLSAEGTGTAPNEDATPGDLPTPGPGADLQRNDVNVTPETGADGEEQEVVDEDAGEDTGTTGGPDVDEDAPGADGEDADDEDIEDADDGSDADSEDVEDADGSDADGDDGGGSTGEEELLCAGASVPTGKGKPFDAVIEYTGKNGNDYVFDCTKCPGGTPPIDGAFRYFDEDPSETTFGGDETMTVDSNAFETKVHFGFGQFGTLTGYFFCPANDALYDFTNASMWTHMFVFETVQPQNEFSTTEGTLRPCWVDTWDGDDVIAVSCNVPWDAAAGVIQPGNKYCRIGTMIDGVPCTDPFDGL